MNSRVTSLENTKAFIRENLTSLVSEFAQWQLKGTLLDNAMFREAARKLDSITSMGSYGKNNYVTGRLKIVETLMMSYLVNDHLDRAGYLGENI